MRISDWSSDVCSSDLSEQFDEGVLAGSGQDRRPGGRFRQHRHRPETVPRLRRTGGADLRRGLIGFRPLRRLFMTNQDPASRSDDRQCERRKCADVPPPPPPPPPPRPPPRPPHPHPTAPAPPPPPPPPPHPPTPP